MHWLLFRKLQINKWNVWDLIRFWKRFSDDILGRWRGTIRQFHLFVAELNRHAKPFGIQFAGAQIGSSVNYLDVKLYLDSEGQIQYKIYRKETDARNYLNPSSFHPNNVFDSVIFSQMLRVINHNSMDQTCVTDLQELREDLMRSGHREDKIDGMEPLAVQRSIENNMNKAKGTMQKGETGQVLVFTTKFFKEVNQLKALVKTVEGDIKVQTTVW